jgi:hypothetical protein
MKNKFFLKLALFFIAVGAIFNTYEKYFYRYMDSDGWLHESIFFPLGMFSLLIGVLIVIFIIVFYFVKYLFYSK